ncbi:homoserine kinase [Sporosarcina sp. HYO08]|uniref:homoserine kinase n=1 Tax=Sporosarcina sp. HYO08 TaxID=1759557 RepID=UPI0007936EB2|nr:homoserine kinase [Sporosarcina sp. HYO08]KXH86707.1 homoserine kinase [Sporosarcina sp. HYO08]
MGAQSFSVTVPATTANLGPGYDSLGLALSLYTTIDVSSADEWLVQYEGEEYQSLATGEDNLIVQTIQDIAKRYKKVIPPQKLTVQSNIPLGKGLGSSATAIAAGIEIVDHLLSLDLSPKMKVRIGSELEGHADNVSAALLGGVTISYFVEEEMEIVHLPEPDVGAVILVPPHALKTEESRGLLPGELTHAEATAGSAASNLLTAAIAQNDWEMAGRMMEKDIFHEPYRKKLFPNFDEVRAMSKSCGAYGMTISGAGPSLFVVVPKGTEETLAKQLAVAFPYYKCLAVQPSTHGAGVNCTHK